jgi:2-C-methyl-D-erythritol 4-phosphate cytidylyltransferase/2-C-methyl-D-erythritol 2,4-cyclodiphosphate synthase
VRRAVLITAAGLSQRFGSGKKELALLDGRSILDLAVKPFLSLPGLEALMITAPAGREAELRAALSAESLAALEALGPGRFAVVAGGPSRRDSVRLGLEAIAEAVSPAAESMGALDKVVVLVHDGARPWLTADLASRVAAAAAKEGAALPVVSLVDTPKELGTDGMVAGHPARAALGGAQTPQGFRLGSLLTAHRKAAEEGVDCTDDTELWSRYVGKVAWLAGETGNRKVTYAADLPAAAAVTVTVRIGQGWDLHRLVPGRRLMLGGVQVPSDKGEEAHSDGDVLLHAIIDALLGAAALGDIGTHFPPSDARWKDADSRDLARAAASLVGDCGWEIGNLDCTVVLEAPRLGPHREAIRASIAGCLGIETGAISFKAKTKEGVDAVGEGRAIEAMAIALLHRRGD